MHMSNVKLRRRTMCRCYTANIELHDKRVVYRVNNVIAVAVAVVVAITIVVRNEMCAAPASMMLWYGQAFVRIVSM